jgi:hypothetical protein
MRPLILASALLAAIAAVPLSVNAASYVPATPTATALEASDALRHDVHGRDHYRRGGQTYWNPLWSFLAPYRYDYRYGHAKRDYRHDRGYHYGHYKRDRDRGHSRHHRRDHKWWRDHDDDFDAHEWNRRQQKFDPGR